MTVFKSQDKLTFGKYKGRTVESVAPENPQYLLWAQRTIDWCNFEDDMVKFLVARSALLDASRPHRPYRGPSVRGFGDDYDHDCNYEDLDAWFEG